MECAFRAYELAIEAAAHAHNSHFGKVILITSCTAARLQVRYFLRCHSVNYWYRTCLL